MLSAEDVDFYFHNVPKKFKLTINNVDYMLNSEILKAISDFFADYFKQSPKSLEYSATIPISNESIKSCINYITNCKIEIINPLDQYIFASYFKIYKIIEKVTPTLLTQINIRDFLKLLDYPEYINELVPFMIENRSQVLDCVLYRDVPSKTLEILYKIDELFENEDQKARFILRKVDLSVDHNFEHFSCLKFEKLSTECLQELIEHPMSESIMKNIRLISSDIPEAIKMFDSLNSELQKLENTKYLRNKELSNVKQKRNKTYSEVLKNAELIQLNNIFVENLTNLCNEVHEIRGRFGNLDQHFSTNRNSLEQPIKHIHDNLDKIYATTTNQLTATLIPNVIHSAEVLYNEWEAQMKEIEHNFDELIPSDEKVNEIRVLLDQLEATLLLYIEKFKNL